MSDFMDIEESVEETPEVDLEALLNSYKVLSPTFLRHPWPSPNLRQLIVESPQRIRRQDEILVEKLAEPEFQRRYQRKWQNYPAQGRLCELFAEWEELCRFSQVLLWLQGQKLPKLEESERSIGLRILEMTRITPMPVNQLKGKRETSFHHLNLYGEAIEKGSRTPPAVSYWAAKSFPAGIRNTILSKQRCRIADRVRASEAARWLDPVFLTHSGISIDGRGSILYESVKDHVERAYLPQGRWKRHEALPQHNEMHVTSKDPWLNPRVEPYIVTTRDVHVNDDGRWHPPHPPRRREEVKHEPSCLQQEIKPEELEETPPDEEEKDDNQAEEYMDSYEHQSQIEDPSEHPTQGEEARTAAIDRLRIM